jgi:uncharacterized coiled-coil DUF342 family protein
MTEEKTKEEPTKEKPATPKSKPTSKKEDVKRQLGVAKDEVEMLKAELAAANKKKEEAFTKKQEIGTAIADKIKQVGDFKKSRDQLTKQVRDLKKKRDQLNDQINIRIAEIKKLTDGKPMPKFKEERRGRRDRRDKRGDESPQGIKRRIEQLEFKLETQPMGFAAEQKLTKEIRDLKKKHDTKMQAFAGMEDVMEKSKQIDKLKREANDLHAQVTKLASDSQKKHEDLITQSKEIDDLKKQEEDLYKSFLEQKKIFAEINARLKAKMGVLTETKSTVKQEKAKVRKKKEEEDKKTLKERAKEAEKKVKEKKKLTTEDLLALQGMK